MSKGFAEPNARYGCMVSANTDGRERGTHMAKKSKKSKKDKKGKKK